MLPACHSVTDYAASIVALSDIDCKSLGSFYKLKKQYKFNIAILGIQRTEKKLKSPIVP